MESELQRRGWRRYAAYLFVTAQRSRRCHSRAQEPELQCKMESVETTVRTPMQIFSLPQQLVVPLFQRPYVWEQEE